MKKSLILVGLLSIGYAHAQYDGKVGVNTEEPKATLDITANKPANGETTKEGLLIPRLSKERIAKIIDPETSTMVYVNDASYTGTEATVAKVDGVGFYYFNGTEWVKDFNLWQKQTNGDILLVDNNIENEVKYNPGGGHWNVPKELRKVSDLDPNTLQISTVPIDFNNDIAKIGNSLNVNLGYADKIRFSNANNLYKEKYLVSNYLLVDEKDNSPIDRLFAQRNMIHSNETSTRNYNALYAFVNGAEHYGTGRVSLLMGLYNAAAVYNGTADRVVGSYNQVGHRVATKSNILEATYNMANPRGQGHITGLYGTRNHIILDQRSSNTLTYAIGSNNVVDIKNEFGGTIDKLMGVNVSFDAVAKTTGIKEMYGLRISNANKGTDVINGYTKNYAIHTGQGKVRLGDDVMIKTDIIAPKSSLTVQGHIAVGEHSPSTNRALFIGASGGALTPGGFIGFGAYTNGQTGYNTTRDNATDLKHRFFIINDMRKGKFHFSPFTANDGKVEESFDPINEAAMTISHEGKKVGIGTNSPSNRLHVKADSNPVRLEGLQAGSSTDKVVVVDTSGILKTVERASIGGGSQGIAVEADGVIGNEVSGVITGGGLKVDGSGTKESPLKVGVAEGGITTGMLSAGSVTGEKIANGSVTSDKLNIPGTNKGDVLVWNGSSWVSQAPQSGASLDAITGAVKVVTAITKATWAEKVDGKGIFALSQTGDAAIQLPNPADYKFRIIAVNNQYTNQLNYASEYSPTYSALDSGKGHLLISDGQKWMIIGGSF